MTAPVSTVEGPAVSVLIKGGPRVSEKNADPDVAGDAGKSASMRR
jgi:hypothetical protein